MTLRRRAALTLKAATARANSLRYDFTTQERSGGFSSILTCAWVSYSWTGGSRLRPGASTTLCFC